MDLGAVDLVPHLPTRSSEGHRVLNFRLLHRVTTMDISWRPLVDRFVDRRSR